VPRVVLLAGVQVVLVVVVLARLGHAITLPPSGEICTLVAIRP